MRKILTLLLCLLLCLLTTACGFNHIMKKELSNPESYGTFTVTVGDTEYLNFDKGLDNIIKMMQKNPGL